MDPRHPARLAFAWIAAAGIGCSRGPEEGPPAGARPSAATEERAAAPGAARVEPEAFVDVTARAGIRFRHVCGATGRYFLIETFGGGAAWLDYDGDGDMDLYGVSGHEDPYRGREPGRARNRLFRNEGRGTFRDVTDEAGVGDRHYGQGVAVGDYDDDGDPDIYVTNFGPNVLYRNEGDGTFTDITREAGIGCPLWNSSATFADLDRDGHLDLYVGSYLSYDPRTAKTCRDADRIGYCHPREFPGTPDKLYRNRGDGTFEEIGRRAGVAIAGPQAGKALGVVATDYDDDGDPDIYVANDETPNFLFRNRGDGTFEEVAMELGVALDRHGQTEAGMGVDAGDVDGDGLLDLHVTNYAQETNALYVQEPGHLFHNADISSGLATPTFLPLAFGMALLDYDLDGDLDIYAACGHIMDAPDASGGLGPRQPDLLFRNRGDGTFEDLSARAGRWFAERRIGRGAAFGDYDDDGDLDIFVVNKGDEAALLENRAGRGHALRLRLVGTRGNRDGFGARITARVGGATRITEARSGRSYASACDPRVVIGLGPETRVASVAIRWPGGGVQVLRDPPIDRTLTVVEPREGRAER